MRRKACGGLAVVCLALAAGSAGAQQGPGDARNGRELALRLCTNCHQVTPEANGPVNSDVVSFPAVANRPGVTAEMLAGRIIVPHPAMPGVQLTVRELRDIVAYILSLKQAK